MRFISRLYNPIVYRRFISKMTHQNPTSSDHITQQLAQLRIEATKQGENVRLLKQSGNTVDVNKEIERLVEIRQKISALEKLVVEDKPFFYKDRIMRENLLKRRFFIAPAYEIYGGVAGLFDYGPPGCALKNAVETLWRNHFVLEEDMLEISGPCLTPHAVLKTSGHVDRFTDLMVKDTITGECFRADKYLEDHIDHMIQEIRNKAVKQKTSLTDTQIKEIENLELIQRQADAFSAEEMKDYFKSFNMVSPKGHTLSDPFPFNLMFNLKIGPKDEQAENDMNACDSNKGYLRPETAQGIFVNFRRLYEHNGGKMPFAVATLGLGFRNEIAPRNGLLRVREFQMGEIEHFCHPDMKNDIPKFENVKDILLPIFPRKSQLGDGKVVRDLKVQDALNQGLIDNKTLAYFLCRTFLFITKCGIRPEYVRFRQHLESEMAHYSNDCWDLEIHTSYGWIEAAGHADRSAFDLTNHTKSSKVDLFAMEKFDTPQEVTVVNAIPNKALIGKTFKQKQTLVLESLLEKSNAEKMEIESILNTQKSYTLSICTGESFIITREMIQFEEGKSRISERSYIPCVIEPSFGIGRILHCIMEHVYYNRGIEGQEERSVMAFPAIIAPTKLCILPLSNNAVMMKYISGIREKCVHNYISFKIDSSTASIGKRYARNDEIGIPFAITIDFQTDTDSTVTLRERDSMQQIRIPIENVVDVVKQLCNEIITWADTCKQYPMVHIEE